MNLLPALTLLGLVSLSFGAPQFPSMGGLSGLSNLINRFFKPIGAQNSFPQSFNLNNFNRPNHPNQYQPSQFGQAFNGPYQPFQIGRTANDPNQAAPVLSGENAPLGLTVDFDSSFGSFPLGVRNELTPAQRNILLPVMESLERVMESSRPNAQDVNTLMKQVRDLLKTVPEGQQLNLKQWGFDTDALGVDFTTLKNVALPPTGDIVITENGQDKIVTTFGTFPLTGLMTKSEREMFLPAVRSFIKLLKKDFLNPTETRELLDQVRKLDSWNLFPFDVRASNEPRKKQGSGTTFNMGALASLISGLMNSQMSGNFVP